MAWWNRSQPGDDGRPSAGGPSDIQAEGVHETASAGPRGENQDPPLGALTGLFLGRTTVPAPSQELFDEWVEAQDPRLDHFDLMVLPRGMRRDFSRESLADIEQMLLRDFPAGSSFLEDADADLIEGLTRYVGETFLRHVGGTWTYSTDPKDITANQPSLALDNGSLAPLTPVFLLHTTVSRREPQLTSVFDNMVRAKKAHLASGEGIDDPSAPAPGEGSGLHRRLRPLEPSTWAAAVPERLARWREQVETDPIAQERFGFVPDLTPASLTGFAAYVKDRIPTVDAMDDPSNIDFVEGAVTYLGEVMRASAGGEWVHGGGQRNEDNPFQGVPYVTVEEGPDVISGMPYWGVRDLVSGEIPNAVPLQFENYVGHPPA